jgi:predicted GIY-YIG superfamily endonuclease
MKKYYVYELINHYGTIEYVGETYRPKGRMYDHTKCKPSGRNGKFYGRQDLVMNIVSVFDNRKDARELEGKLKLDYGMEHTEITRTSKGGKIQGPKNAESGHMKRMAKLAGKKAVESGQLARLHTIIHETNKKPVLQYSISGDFIKEWDSAKNVQIELKTIYATNITQCCKSSGRTTGGYIWKYKQQ